MSFSRAAFRFGIFLLAVVGIPQSLEGNNLWKRASSRRIQIKRLPDIEVPEGSVLRSVSYTPHSDGKITFLRRFLVEQGYSGLSVRTIRKRDASATEDYQPFTGLRIVSIDSDSPAEKVGLRRDDRIIYVDGELMGNPARFHHLVQYHDLQEPMRLQIMRGQDRLEVDLKLTSKQVEELDVEQAIVPMSHENRHTGELGEKKKDSTHRFAQHRRSSPPSDLL